MSEENKKVYSEDNIKSLDTIAAIRLRPAMYVDGIGELGLYKIDSEVVQNCFDEFLIDEATYCKIYYDSNRGYMRVEDDGRGIPIGKLEDIYTKAHTGGKFDRDAYKISSGQNGIGAKAANALSSWCKVEVYRLGYIDENGNKIPPRHGVIEFENGRKVSFNSEDLPETSTRHGTTVEYITDDTILGTHIRNVNRFKDYLNTISYIDPGIRIEYVVDGVKNVYFHDGGMIEFLKDFSKSKNLKYLIDPVTITGVSDDNLFSFDIMFTYGPNNTGDSNIISFVNGNRTPSHGTHVSAFRAGVALALTQYIQESDMTSKFPKGITASGTIISDNIIGIVGVRHSGANLMFSGQTKEAFNGTEVTEPIKGEARNAFGKWLRNNPNQAKKLINLAIDYAKYEAERKKLKQNMLDTKQVKSAFAANGIDPEKYTTCRSNKPEERELFIVEGDSAGGNVALAQDRNFQALYRLTGKTLNVVKASKNNLSKVILELIQALGMGLPGVGRINYDNLQYNKIIILTDADDDGAHITTLLLGFLHTFYPRVIEDGHVYIANPPIKKMTLTNGSSFYIRTDSDYDILMREFIVNSFEFYNEVNNKKLSEGLFRAFIDSCNGYDNLIDNHSKALALNPDLLERICVYMETLSQCTNDINNQFNKKFYKLTGYMVRRAGNSDMFTFDKGTYHTFMKLDRTFIENHFDIIVDKLNEIRIYGIYLKGIRSGKEYHGTIYELMSIMNSILGPKIRIERFKGLGEMDLLDLSETAVNPLTRTLTQVSMEDCKKADRAMQIFMTDADIKFKRLFYAGKVKFD